MRSLILLFLLLPLSLLQLGFRSNIAFMKNQPSRLVFSTPLQNVPVGICSNVITVQHYGPQNTASNVVGNLLVNLSASGDAIFYSDIGCTNPITSVTIGNGTSSSSFYFIKATTGVDTVTVSATNKLPANQNESGVINNYVWTGGGGNANWTTGANWSGGTAPGATNPTLFNSTCVTNCSPTIDASISIDGIRIASGYAGTITQGAGSTISLASRGWSQAAGTFIGSSAAITISPAGGFATTGGTFTSTSGTLMFLGNTILISQPAQFVHNSGTVQFGNCNVGSSGSDTAITVNAPNGWNLYHFTTNPSWGVYNSISAGQTVTVLGNFTQKGYISGGGYSQDHAMFGGTISVQGDYYPLAGTSGRGTTVLRFEGTGPQTIFGTGSTWPVGNPVVIAKPSGTLTFNGEIAFTESFTYTSGTVDTTGSIVDFGSNHYYDDGMTISTGSIHFNDLNIKEYSGYRPFVFSGTTYVDGNLFYASIGAADQSITGADIQVKGNVTIDGYGYSSTVNLTLTGTANQTITYTSGALIPSGTWTINKASGVVTLASNLPINRSGQDLIITAGTLNMAGYNLTVGRNISNSGTLQRGTNPTCGTLTYGGSYAGAAATCP